MYLYASNLCNIYREKVQEASVKEGTKHTHCVFAAVVGASISKRADAPLVLIPLLASANVNLTPNYVF